MPIINFTKYLFLHRHDNVVSETKTENIFLNKLKNKLNQTQYKESYHRDGNLKHWIHELHSRPENYFYLEFIHPIVLTLYKLENLMTAQELQELKDGKINLVIGNTGHGYFGTIGEIYKNIVFKHNINPENILLRTESPDIIEELNLIHIHLSVPKIKVEWVREFEFTYQYYCKDYNLPNTLENKLYNKKFFSLNGLPRKHRTALLFLLQCFNQIDNGFVSFAANYNYKNDEYKNYINNILDSYKNYHEVYYLLSTNRDKLENISKIILDNTSSVINVADPDLNHNIYYENSYFSLVTETSFPNKAFDTFHREYTDTGRILSEKIFKPILNKHPFIVVSNYQTLALLKSLGYRSFSPYIDESYDEIKDDKERLFVIAKEVKRLCELNENELQEFLIYCKKICEFNFNVLKTQTKFYKKLN